MKITTPSKDTFLFLSLIPVSLFIWYEGAEFIPSIALPEKRIFIIAALFLGWLLKFILFESTPSKTKTVAAKINSYTPKTTKKLQGLQGRFKGAMDFLRKTVINKHGIQTNLASLPWYLLIGPSGSGKTSLLANSEINFILSKQFKTENASTIPPSDNCDWWVTRDLVLVDIPGDYLITKEKTPIKNPQSTSSVGVLWNNLLGLIKKSSSKEKVSGVVIALNFPELMKKTTSQRKTQIIHDLKKRIIELRAIFGTQLPFHIIITKCDLLPGFTEFFSESGVDELTQAWGIVLPPPQGKEKLTDIFTHRFNALIKRINKQLIWRLHQERNPNARPYIKDFPLHIERLKEMLAQFIKALAIPDLHLQGIYLTSAAQMPAEEPTHYIHSASSNLTHQSLQIMQAPVMPSRTYFVKQLILQGLLIPTDHHPVALREQKSWHPRAVYATAIGAIVVAALLLGYDFQHSLQKTYALQNDLAHYQLYMQQSDNSGNQIAKALPLLNALQKTTVEFDQHASIFSRVLSFYSHKSQETANAVYQQALQTIVLPEIKNSLEASLHNTSSKNFAHTYTALKAYLMLKDSQHLQASFIANVLNHALPSSMSKNDLSQLAHHIHTALINNQTPIELDEGLITQTRDQLANLPSNELAMVILKNMDENNSDSVIDIGTTSGNPPIFVSKDIANRIPNMFTANHFQKIMTDEAIIAATEALKGNWVIGDVTPNAIQPTPEALATQLRNQYTANYIDLWESLLANVRPNTFKTLRQLDDMILTLTSNHSPLLELLQTIKQNTSFSPINTSSPKIQALNNLLASADINQQGSLYQAFTGLRQLHTYLQAILVTSNGNLAAFQAAAQRTKNAEEDPITVIHRLAEQNPEPIRGWLNTIANQSWGFILQGAGQHIESAWQTDILPIYKAQIANRYPFNQDTHQEVDLKQFTAFLGHQGKLAVFYQTFLKPFINDAHNPWSWRTVDNQQIPFSNAVLISFQHAAQLQHAFFAGGDKLLVQFTLQPVELESRMKSFSLNINGEEATYQKNGPHAPKEFVWPGKNSVRAATINFMTPSNQVISNTAKGDWGWFRLVTNATQNSINPRRGMLLNFSVNGHIAKYVLTTQGYLNPFLPLNLSRFDLPGNLLN